MDSVRDMAIGKAEHQLLDELQAEIDRFERIEAMMRSILEPVLVQIDQPDRAMTVPEEAPQHDYHTAILRLRRTNNRLEDLRSIIRL